MGWGRGEGILKKKKPKPQKQMVKKGGGGCRGRDRMVVGFTTTYAISAYHH